MMQTRKSAQDHKPYRSSDWSLQLDFMKLELPVIVYQHGTVNLYLSLVHIARHTLGEDLPWKPVEQYPSRKNVMDSILFVSVLNAVWGEGSRLEWSRNKVAVGEPAAGSIPFWNHCMLWSSVENARIACMFGFFFVHTLFILCTWFFWKSTTRDHLYSIVPLFQTLMYLLCWETKVIMCASFSLRQTFSSHFILPFPNY